MGRQTFTILVLFHSTITTGKECVPKIVLVSFKLLNDLLFTPFAVTVLKAHKNNFWDTFFSRGRTGNISFSSQGQFWNTFFFCKNTGNVIP